MNIPEFIAKLTAGVHPDDLDKYTVSVRVGNGTYGATGISTEPSDPAKVELGGRVIIDAS